MPELSEQARDMLLNAETRVGGAPGIGTDAATAELKAAKLLSPRGNLTAKGLSEHYEIGRAEGWYPADERTGR